MAIQVETIVSKGWAKSFIVGDDTTSDAIIINPANAVRKIVEVLIEHRWKPHAIFLTKGDLTHSARAAELRRRYQIPVFAPQSELLSLQNLPAEGEKAHLCGVKIPIVNEFVHKGDIKRFGEVELQVIEVKDKSKSKIAYKIGKKILK